MFSRSWQRCNWGSHSQLSSLWNFMLMCVCVCVCRSVISSSCCLHTHAHVHVHTQTHVHIRCIAFKAQSKFVVFVPSILLVFPLFVIFGCAALFLSRSPSCTCAVSMLLSFFFVFAFVFFLFFFALLSLLLSLYTKYVYMMFYISASSLCPHLSARELKRTLARVL